MNVLVDEQWNENIQHSNKKCAHLKQIDTMNNTAIITIVECSDSYTLHTTNVVW